MMVGGLAAGQIRAGGEAVPPSQIAHETILPENRADFHLRGCNCQSGGGGVILDLEVHFTLAGEPGTMAIQRFAPRIWPPGAETAGRSTSSTCERRWNTRKCTPNRPETCPWTNSIRRPWCKAGWGRPKSRST